MRLSHEQLRITDLKSPKSLLFFSNFLLFDHFLYVRKQSFNVAHEVVVRLIQIFLRQLSLLHTGTLSISQQSRRFFITASISSNYFVCMPIENVLSMF